MVDPHEGKAVMSNVAFLSGLQAITYILPIVILPYLFRVIGPEKFGLIAFAQAFVQYFMIITDYGFTINATKEIPAGDIKVNESTSVNQASFPLKCNVSCSIDSSQSCTNVTIIPQFNNEMQRLV